jgi:hypothetical protein
MREALEGIPDVVSEELRVEIVPKEPWDLHGLHRHHRAPKCGVTIDHEGLFSSSVTGPTRLGSHCCRSGVTRPAISVEIS